MQSLVVDNIFISVKNFNNIQVWNTMCLKISRIRQQRFLNKKLDLEKKYDLENATLSDIYLVSGPAAGADTGASMSHPMYGAVTDLNIWSRLLGAGEMAAWADCTHTPGGDLLSWAELTRTGLAAAQELDLEAVCGGSSQVFEFNAFHNFQNSKRFCKSIGGVVTETVVDKTIGGVKRDSNNTRIKLMAFSANVRNKAKESIIIEKVLNISSTFKCANYTNDENVTYVTIKDFPCPFPFPFPRLFGAVMVCEIDKFPPRFKLRGGCKKYDCDDTFVMMDSKSFLGVRVKNITYSATKERWELYDSAKDELLAHTAIKSLNTFVHSSEQLPLGVQEWTPVAGKCAGGNDTNIRRLNFHLEVPQPGYFCCDNGFCISSEQVCDGIPFCQHQEDEKDCKMITIPHFYNSIIPPLRRKPKTDEIEFLDTPLTVDITLMDLLDINEADSSFEIFFTVNVEWYDFVLNFEFLKEDANRNIVQNTSKIWLPEIGFYHIKSEILMERGVIVNRGAPKLSGGAGKTEDMSLNLTHLDISFREM